MKVVFFGTPKFAADILEYLIDHDVDIVAVVTKPDRPKGRSGQPSSPPVKMVAQKKLSGIPIYQPDKVSIPEYYDLLASYDADLFVVVAYGEILKQPLLDIPKLDCINVHASLLPKFRGAAPIPRCLMAGEKKTGVTIMRMVKKMDAGNILATTEVPITEMMTAGELESLLCQVGAECLLQVIKDFEGGPLEGVPQDEVLATYAPKVEAEEGLLHWNASADSLHHLIRAFTPHPGAWCFVKVRHQKKRMKVQGSVVVSGQGQPGDILSYGDEGFVVACGDEALRLTEVQLEGKRKVSAEEFCRGIPRELFCFF